MDWSRVYSLLLPVELSNQDELFPPHTHKTDLGSDFEAAGAITLLDFLYL